MDGRKIRAAQDLQKRIRDVESFLLVFDESCNVRRGLDTEYEKKDINGFIKLKTKKTISIFGGRYFGFGTHETSLEIPFDMIEGIERQWRKKLETLKKEFEEL